MPLYKWTTPKKIPITWHNIFLLDDETIILPRLRLLQKISSSRDLLFPFHSLPQILDPSPTSKSWTLFINSLRMASFSWFFEPLISNYSKQYSITWFFFPYIQTTTWESLVDFLFLDWFMEYRLSFHFAVHRQAREKRFRDAEVVEGVEIFLF